MVTINMNWKPYTVYLYHSIGCN